MNTYQIFTVYILSRLNFSISLLKLTSVILTDNHESNSFKVLITDFFFFFFFFFMMVRIFSKNIIEFSTFMIKFFIAAHNVCIMIHLCVFACVGVGVCARD